MVNSDKLKINNKIDVSLTNSGQVVLNNSKNKINEDLFGLKLNENVDKYKIDPSYEKKFIEILNSKEKFSFFSFIELYEAEKYFDKAKLVPFLYFRYKFRCASRNKVVWDAPPHLLIEPVSACNFRCPMCFQIDKTFTRKPYMGLMKWDLFKKVVDEADEIGVGSITLASRGEPTMHPQLGKMLKYISEKKNIFQIKLNTNASRINKKLCDEIFDSDLTTIVISGDHYEKEKYEYLRKNSVFEDIVSNVKLLFETRKNYPNCKTEIRISGIDLKKDLDRDAFSKFWSKMSDNVSVGDAIERWDTYNNPKDNLTSACNFLWDRMYVWFDGKVNPCDADYKSFLSFGDVSKESIATVWKSQKIQLLRSKHLEKLRGKINPCDRCGLDFH